jgi:hypothetical protein
MITDSVSFLFQDMSILGGYCVMYWGRNPKGRMLNDMELIGPMESHLL